MICTLTLTVVGVALREVKVQVSIPCRGRSPHEYNYYVHDLKGEWLHAVQLSKEFLDLIESASSLEVHYGVMEGCIRSSLLLSDHIYQDICTM